MQLHRIITIVFLMAPFQLYSEGFFENLGVFKNELELSKNLCLQITFFPSIVNEQRVDSVIAQLDKNSTNSNLNRAEVIKYLMSGITREIEHYHYSKSYDNPRIVPTLCLAALFAVMAGGCVYAHITRDQYKQAIENKLSKLGARSIITGIGGAHAFVSPHSVNKEEIRNQLRHLDDADGFGVGALLFGSLTLLFGITGINDLLEHKYAAYYEKKLLDIKQMLESKLEYCE